MIDERQPSPNPGNDRAALEDCLRTVAVDQVVSNLNWEVALGLGGPRKKRKSSSQAGDHTTSSKLKQHDPHRRRTRPISTPLG